MMFEKGNVNYANKVQKVLSMEFKTAITDIWIGLEIEFTQQCSLMYQSMNITPYVTLTVAKDTEQRKLGQ